MTVAAGSASALCAQQNVAAAQPFELPGSAATEPASGPSTPSPRAVSYAYQRALARGFGLERPVSDREFAAIIAHIAPFAYMLAAGRWEAVENAFDDVWQAHSARTTWVQHGVTAAAFTAYGAGAATAIGSSPLRGLRAVSTVMLTGYVIRETHGAITHGATVDGLMDMVGPASVYLAVRLAVPKR